MTKKYTFIISIIALTFLITGISYAEQNSGGSLTEVDGIKVCMVTNQLFIKDQIPVELEGKTYYGCCEMCKGRLENDPEMRVAVDPISGNEIDKSEAVIGASADGSIYYFESEENLKKYNP